jgi:hypothetical protein
MKGADMSRTTYYGLVRDNLMNEHSKMFNLLLILALLVMTGLAAFLTSDILSIASDSSYKGAIAHYLSEPKKGFIEPTAANSSDSKKSPLSTGITKTAGGNITEKLNASNQSGIKDSSNSSRIDKVASSKSENIISSGGSSSSSTSSKKSSSGSKNHRSSSKSSSSSKSTKIENNSQNNSTQLITAQTNQTLINQSSSNQSQINKTNDMTFERPVVKMEFKTNSNMKSTSNSGQVSEKTINWPSSNLITSSKPGDDQGDQQVNKKKITRNTISKRSRDSTAKSKLTARNSQVKTAQSKRVTSSATSIKRPQSTRDLQKANRSKALESKKKKLAESRARAASR